MTTDRPRLLIIGLDSAAPALVARWAAAEGRLPVMAELMKEGAWAQLQSVPNMLTPAAWTTFMTGKNPGRHGIFSFSERLPGSYRHRFINGSMRDGTPFWRLLDRAGFRVGVMNVPMTYPVERINGFMIAGLDAPTPYAPGFVHPPDLIVDLERQFGRFGHGPVSGDKDETIGRDLLRGRVPHALRTLVEGVENRTRWAEHLLQRFRPDVFVIVIPETDAAQHFFWSYMDPRHPAFTPALAARYGDYVRRVYEKADESIGRLIKAFGDDATLMILSDHGAGIAQMNGVVFLEALLGALGLRVVATAKRGRFGRAQQRFVRNLYEAVNPHVPGEIKALLRARAPHLFHVAKAQVRGQTIWEETKAYAAYDFWGIWVNVKGREPAGIVDPGAEYEEVRSQIIAHLLACVDPVTGERIVEHARRREEVYSGPYVDRAPDIHVTFRDGVFRGFELGRIRVFLPAEKPADPQEARSGLHRHEGILILAGKSVSRGAVLRDPQLADIAPTVLYALDCPLPDGLDGRVLHEAFEFNQASRPVRRAPAARAEAAEHQGYSATEEAAVAARLRALGYF